MKDKLVELVTAGVTIYVVWMETGGYETPVGAYVWWYLSHWARNIAYCIGRFAIWAEVHYDRTIGYA